MPDGRPTGGERDPADDRSLAADARLVRDVRWRLVLWSGGTTLLVLLVLAAALYLSAARSLEANGLKQLDNRADGIEGFLRGSHGGPGPSYGFAFGGDASGTYAMLLFEDGHQVDPRAGDPPAGLPDLGSLDAAADGAEDVRLLSLEALPVRVLTRRIPTTEGDVFIQVVGDRRPEQTTLDAILTVLIGGGLLVVVVAFGFGAVYARRALVPIRESLASQRAALRRQREFAADASHELRTPLTVIRSSVDHLRRHRDEPVSAVTEAVDDIDAEVANLTSLVDDLLLLARSDSGALDLARSSVDLGDVAADGAGALAKPATEKGVGLVVDPEPAHVLGDPPRLRRLAMILVDNAIRHGPPGSEVRVRVRRSAGEAILEVDDEGPGVKPEDMPRIFERFWRAPGGNGGGAGLGLAIARSIVDLHGGRIAVSNRDGGGARFTVRLPAEPDRPAAEPSGLPGPLTADRPG